MKRILIASIVALSSFLTVGSSTHISAATDATPPVGIWTWCTETIVNGCIEAVTTISPEKVETVYTSKASLPNGLTVIANCSANGPVNTCDTNRYISRDDGTCVEASTWGGRFTTPSIEFSSLWEGKSGWDIRVRLSTGNFQPAFTIGRGTTAVSITNDGDGTFTYTNTSKMEKAYLASLPPESKLQIGGDPQAMAAYSEWLKTAIATEGKDSVHSQLWPRDHLFMGSSSPGLPENGCKYFPFESAWAEANATGFSWSYSWGNPASPVPNVLTFTAQAPHYLPQVSGQPLEVMPARVQVFLPTSYFEALGYSSLTEINSSSYAIATEDGQVTTPTATVQETGILINLGVQHYSSPNPSITFVVAPKMVKKSSKKLSSLISYKLSGTKSWKVTGGCTIVGTKLRAPNKKATCKLTLTVRNSKKKIVATKTKTIKVS